MRLQIAVTLSYLTEEPATQILQRSGGFCKMPVSWEYRGSQICFVLVEGQVVSESTGATKAEARDKAADLAVKILGRHCYTIQVKSPYLSDGTQVDLMDVQVNTEVGGKSEAIGGESLGLSHCLNVVCRRKYWPQTAQSDGLGRRWTGQGRGWPSRACHRHHGLWSGGARQSAGQTQLQTENTQNCPGGFSLSLSLLSGPL